MFQRRRMRTALMYIALRHIALRRWFVTGFACCGIGVAIGGCNADNAIIAPRPDVETLFWDLTVDIQATTIAVGGTQRIVVTPRTVSGEPMTEYPAIVFTSDDTAKVKVDQNGLITGLMETDGVLVAAFLTATGVTDSVKTNVMVTTESYTLQSFRILADDDPFILHGQLGTIVVEALDDHGDPIDGISFLLTSLNPGVLATAIYSITGPEFYATGIGRAKLVAKTVSYGVVREDTVEYRTGWPRSGWVYVQEEDVTTGVAFSPNAVVVGVTGIVNWSSNTGDPVTVEFDGNPASVECFGTEDIQPFDSGYCQFFEAGTYTYRNPHTGMTGRVIVREDPE